MLPLLETTRLILKPFIAEHAENVYEMAKDYAIYQSTLNIPHPYEPHMALEWIQTHEKNHEETGMVTLGAFIKESNTLVGAFSLGVLPKTKSAEIGYWVGEKYWNKGYASEAAKALVDYGFAQLNLNRIYGRYLTFNPASRKVMEKTGFVFEGILRESVIKEGTYHDVGYLSILRSDWNKTHPSKAMCFEEIRKIENESEKVNAIYQIYNENERLTRSKAARVEFITTVKYIEEHLKPGMRLLDIGAGAGEYSLYFAKKGFEVDAIELSDANVEVFSKKISPDLKIALKKGNALDLSLYADKTFDLVFLFGPLYHLKQAADRDRCIQEAKRVLKDDGLIFIAFINNDMIHFTEWVHDPHYLTKGDYDKTTFKVEDFPFVFFTLDECREMLIGNEIQILNEVASDGMSELLDARINSLDEAGYEQYLKLHFYSCEKPEMLGHSNHFLFVGRKR